MELINEYLVIIDKKTSSALYKVCTSVDNFNKLLSNNSLIIRKNEISNKKIKCKYNIKLGQVKDKEQYFFYFSICFTYDEKLLDDFDNLISYIKYVLSDDGLNVETLRDDLSFYYSQLAYSKIHKIENFMRKFITYFMIKNLGKNWLDESSPKQIKEALDKSKRKDYMDSLQKLDFIHLGDLLFKSFQEQDISNLSKLINRYKNKKQNSIKLENLLEFLPKSNWDKFFKDIVECDDKFLEERWKELYDLRNKIAHTSSFSKEDFLRIETLSQEIEEKLNKAFENIDNIEINDEDKEKLSESITASLNEDIGKFLKEWNQYEKTIKDIYHINDEQKNKLITTFNNVLKNELDTKTFEEISLLRQYRNNLVHNTEDINQENILKNIEKVRKVLYSTWKIQVLKAFHELGGEAKLKDIYEHIRNNLSKDLTLSDESAIRKSIYFHSSDVELFQGKEDLFQKCGNGKWKLRS